jgi:hypothetical protein
MQQQKHEQHPEFSKLGLHSQTESSLTTSVKLPAVASPTAPAASPSLVCDSLERFVSKVDTRSRAAASYPTSIRSPSSNPDSVSGNIIGRKEDPIRQSSNFFDEGMDSLEAFVVDHSAPAGFSALSVSESAKNSIQYQSGSKSAQKTSAHSLYRIDSASPSLDELDAPKSHPLQFVSRRETRQGENNDDPTYGSWMLPQDASPGIHLAIPSHSPSLPTFDIHPVDSSFSLHGRSRDFSSALDAPSWLSPTIPTTVPLAGKSDSEDFIGLFPPSGCRSNGPDASLLSGAYDKDYDDFIPSFDVSRISSQNSYSYRHENGSMPPIDSPTMFRPVPEGNSREIKAGADVPRDSFPGLVQSAQYIVRDSQRIELLASALNKVHLSNSAYVSQSALSTLLTPILRKFDLVAFANKVDIPTLIAADLVQLAPFSVHFVVDDSGDVLNNESNWNDAQILLQECVDFVSLVNLNGCTITFLASAISQAHLTTKDQVASLFAKVVSTVSLTRFAAVRKPKIISAFESKVFDPVFAGSTPALVYVLSLQDSVTKRDFLSADGILGVCRALDTRIANRLELFCFLLKYSYSFFLIQIAAISLPLLSV